METVARNTEAFTLCYPNAGLSVCMYVRLSLSRYVCMYVCTCICAHLRKEVWENEIKVV